MNTILSIFKFKISYFNSKNMSRAQKLINLAQKWAKDEENVKMKSSKYLLLLLSSKKMLTKSFNIENLKTFKRAVEKDFFPVTQNELELPILYSDQSKCRGT